MLRLFVCAVSVALLSGCASKEESPAETSAPAGETPVETQQVQITDPPEEKSLELEDLPTPDGDADTYSIQQVMQLAHENRLFRQLMSDEPDARAVERLQVLYVALAKQQPPMGEQDSWKKRTEALIAATKAIADGDPTGKRAIQKAVNCQGCHSNHRPE